MENASRALTIAGAVLITILVVAMAVYNYNKISGTADVYSEHFDSIELEKYNSLFNPYIGRKDITAHEIISVAGIATDRNLGTYVFVDGICLNNYTNEPRKEFLSKNLMKYERQDEMADLSVKNTFSFDGIIYSSNGMVKEIKFKKNNV